MVNSLFFMDHQNRMNFPFVPVVDTSVKSLIEQGTPVLPTESQYYDNETPIHVFKSFDFKNMPMDPMAINHARNYVEPTPVQPSAAASAVSEPSSE